MVKIIALDFDGVICDSISECLLTAYNAYYEQQTGQISEKELATTALKEAGNLVGGKIAGKLFGLAGEAMFSGLARSAGVIGTEIDAVKTFSNLNDECEL